jgi:hypothetical protein
MLEQLTDGDLRSAEHTRWPIQDRPFGNVVAWASLELMKNASEIGQAVSLRRAAALTTRSAKSEPHRGRGGRRRGRG